MWTLHSTNLNIPCPLSISTCCTWLCWYIVPQCRTRPSTWSICYLGLTSFLWSCSFSLHSFLCPSCFSWTLTGNSCTNLTRCSTSYTNLTNCTTLPRYNIWTSNNRITRSMLIRCNTWTSCRFLLSTLPCCTTTCFCIVPTLMRIQKSLFTSSLLFKSNQKVNWWRWNKYLLSLFGLVLCTLPYCIQAFRKIDM